jgi:hypothetical protein
MLQTIRYSVPEKRNKRMRGLQMNRCKASFVYSGTLQRLSLVGSAARRRRAYEMK